MTPANREEQVRAHVEELRGLLASRECDTFTTAESAAISAAILALERQVPEDVMFTLQCYRGEIALDHERPNDLREVDALIAKYAAPTPEQRG